MMELKPCPYCGEKMAREVVRGHSQYSGDVSSEVECGNCHALAVSIEAWNRRALSPKSPWVKCSDRLPEVDDVQNNYERTVILVYCGWPRSAIYTGDGFRTEDNVDPVFNVTHWQPITPPIPQ